MEISVGICGTVCRNENVSILKVRRSHAGKLDLHRPLGKLAGTDCPGCRLSVLHLLGTHSRASGERLCFRQFLRTLNGCLVICRRLSLFKRNRIHGTRRQAIAQPVTEMLPHQNCLAVNDVDCTLVASLCTGTAAVAFVPVNVDDFSYHMDSSLYYTIFDFCFS